MTIGGSGKGEIGKGEEEASLHTATGIEMARLNGHLCAGIAFTDIHEPDTIRAGELIVEKESLQLVGIHHKRKRKEREEPVGETDGHTVSTEGGKRPVGKTTGTWS